MHIVIESKIVTGLQRPTLGSEYPSAISDFVDTTRLIRVSLGYSALLRL